MIREMLKSGYEGVRKLMKQVHQLHYVNRPDIFLDGDALSKSYFEKLFQDEYFHYVYVKDDEIVGLLMMEHHVKPRYEATGIELTVWSFNQDAIRFYESLGMTPMNMTMEKKL